MYSVNFKNRVVEFEDVLNNGWSREDGGYVETAWYADTDELLTDEEIDELNDLAYNDIQEIHMDNYLNDSEFLQEDDFNEEDFGQF